jgi:gliding motility-associated-like protein
VNDLPTAEADNASVPEDGSVTVPVLTNDTFGGDGPSTGTITIVTGPTNGTASVDDGGTPNDPTDDQIIYTPDPNYNGPDNIIYEICDSNGDCDTAIVRVTVPPVNDPPAIPDTTVTTPEDTPITVCIPFTDVDVNDTHTPSIGCGSGNGTITSGPTVTGNTVCLTYLPNTNYNGRDSICVVICDNNGLCDTGVVYINIPPVNDPPAIPDTTVTTPEDTPITVCIPFTDVDVNDTHTPSIGCGSGNGTITSGPTVTGNTVCLTYLPNTNYNGRDSICVIICDNNGLCDTGVVHIIVVPNIDTTRHTVPVHLNDTICDMTLPLGNNIIIKSCDGSTIGVTPIGSTWSIDPLTSCLIYTAGPTKGNDTLCITACDTIKQQCNTTIVIITVTGIPPIAINDTIKTFENIPVTIPVLNNDIQTDEDPLTLCDPAVITQPGHGTVVVNQGGTITYTPVTGYSGVDSLQYEICDPEGSDSAWVFITVESGCILPNAFSPNGDGINDVFKIPCAEENVYFSVWNRWGIEVYRNEQYLNDWDGTYKGSPLPDGTYYYVLKYTKSSGEEVNKAGFITLHR